MRTQMMAHEVLSDVILRRAIREVIADLDKMRGQLWPQGTDGLNGGQELFEANDFLQRLKDRGEALEALVTKDECNTWEVPVWAQKAVDVKVVALVDRLLAGALAESGGSAEA